MNPGSLGARRALQRAQPFVCWNCRQSRAISTSWLQKQKEAREQWEEWAKQIKTGKRASVLTVLERRGFLHAVAGESKDLDDLITDKRVGVYAGIDPTAASLHVGHLIPLMALFWLYIHGVHCVTLLGSATAKVGDPTGRTSDRPTITPTERKANTASIHFQLKRLWANVDQLSRTHGFSPDKYWHRELVNNNMWWNKVTVMDLLKVLGNSVRLGPMLARENVKTKLESGDGMSFSEFAYPLLQAWDWWHMYYAKGIQVQIGGSDQFGNIVAGIEAVKHIAKNHTDPDIRQPKGVSRLTTPYGFTVPLLTTSSGVKFGKSSGNAIWLDEGMTSIFDLYGFFVRTSDADVERYLKIFTFASLPTIQSLMTKHKEDPSKRVAQHYLAFQFLSLVHGQAAAKRAENQHRALFRKTTFSDLKQSLSAADHAEPSSPAKGIFSKPVETPEPPPNPLQNAQDNYQRWHGGMANPSLNPFAKQANANSGDTMHVVLPKSLVLNQPVARVLYHAGLVTSRSEGHRLAQNKGAYIGSSASDKEQMNEDLNFVPVKLQDPMQTWRYVIRDDPSRSDGAMVKEGEEGLLILRVGKWKVRLCRIVTDEKFERLVRDGEVPPEGPPGWSEFKAQQAAKRNERELLDGGPEIETEEYVPKAKARSAQREQRKKGLESFRNSARSAGSFDVDVDNQDRSSPRARANVGW